MESLRRELERIVSPHWVSKKLPDRIAYSRDQWPRLLLQLRQKHLQKLPDLIVWPENAQQAAEVLALCHRENALMCPVGGGSSVTGASIPHRGGVVIDLKRLDRIRWMNPEDGVAEVEGGILGIHLEETLQRADCTLGHFPSSIMCSTLGGWAATRSAGQASSRYGKIEDLILDVEVARPDGTITWCKGHYDITPLVVGSEGTMGLITACRIKLYPAPKSRQFRGFLFPTLETGLDTMRLLMQETSPAPSVMRLYDPLDSFISSHRKAKKSSDAVKTLAHPHIPPPGTASQALVPRRPKRSPNARGLQKLAKKVRTQFVAKALQHTDRGLSILERILPSQSLLIVGYEEQSEQEAKRLMNGALSIAAKNNGKDLGEGPGLHWFHARYNTSFKQSQVFNLGAFSDTMEVACSWTQLVPLYHAVRSAIQKEALVMAHFSHAYPDGCSIYFSFAGYDDPQSEVKRYDRIWKSGLKAAASVGATISHHHGVGINKSPAMLDELGEPGANLLRQVQQAMGDPNLLNPGKLLPLVPISSRDDADAPEQQVEPLSSPRLDSIARILWADTRHSLEAIESFAQMHGLSAGFRSGYDFTLQQWLERNPPLVTDTSYPNSFSRLYSLSATLPSNEKVNLGVAPRTSAGPDLRSIFWNTHGSFGPVQSVGLRLRPHSTQQKTFNLSLSSVEEGVSFLQSLAHLQQRPSDAMIDFATSGTAQHLYLAYDPKLCPRIQAWVEEQSIHQALQATRKFPNAHHSQWLALEAQWSRIPHLIQWLREQDYPIESLSLVDFQHATATLHCSFCFSGKESENLELLESIANQCLAHFPEQTQGGQVMLRGPQDMFFPATGLSHSVLQQLKKGLDPTEKYPALPFPNGGAK